MPLVPLGPLRPLNYKILNKAILHSCIKFYDFRTWKEDWQIGRSAVAFETTPSCTDSSGCNSTYTYIYIHTHSQPGNLFSAA